MGADAADLRRERAGRRRRQHGGSGCGPATRRSRRREQPARRAGRCLPDGTDRLRRVPHRAWNGVGANLGAERVVEGGENERQLRKGVEKVGGGVVAKRWRAGGLAAREP